MDFGDILKIRKRNFNYSESFMQVGFETKEGFLRGCDAVYFGGYGALSWDMILTTHHL
jgi:hypothetical protein